MIELSQEKLRDSIISDLGQENFKLKKQSRTMEEKLGEIKSILGDTLLNQSQKLIFIKSTIEGV